MEHVVQHEKHSESRESPRHAGPSPDPARPRQLGLQLQQQAGNQAVQQLRKAGAAARSGGEAIHAAAGRGIASSSVALPHRDIIQAAFGPQHDLAAIQAHIGGVSTDACHDMGANAFATAGHIAFAASPDIRTAAHEAAHVVQQARGVRLQSEVGMAGDVYERHADAVADRVAAGSSAADLLAETPSMAAGGVNRQPANASVLDEETVWPATPPPQSGPSSVARPAPIAVKPTVLNFEQVREEVDAPFTVTNTSDQPVAIDRVVVNGGGNAFSVLMLSGKSIEPGASAQLALEYHPGPHAVDKAFLAISLTTGEEVYVDIVPPSQDRALAATRPGILRISPDPAIFTDVDAPSSSNRMSGQAWTYIAIANPGLTPQKIDRIQFDGSGNTVWNAENWKPLTVEPGATETVQIGVTAKTAGELSGTGSLMTADDRVAGTFQVKAHSESTDWMEDPKKDEIPEAEKKWKHTRDPNVLQARVDAMAAFSQLQANAAATLTNAMQSLRDEWLEYLHITASNPSISSAELGGEPVLGQVLEHTIAGGVAKSAEHVIEHIAHGGHAAAHASGHTAAHAGTEAAEHAADKIAGHAASHATEGAAEEAAAEAGLMIGGAVIGFAVGVLIETLGGLIYHWLSGEDEEIRKQLEEAWKEGFQAGKHALYDAFKNKTGQLNAAEKKATFYEKRKELDYVRLIGSTTDPQRMAQIKGEIQALADLADPATAKIEKGLTKVLLQRWVRDHAADPTHAAADVQQEDWVEATRGASDISPSPSMQYWVGETSNMPDLFVDQAMHEWSRRGLEPNPELAQKMRAEIGATSEPPADRDSAERVAARATSLFRGREFVFRHANAYEFFDTWPHNVKSASCNLELKTREGSCFVSQFVYHLEMDDGTVVRGTAKPGGPLVIDKGSKEFSGSVAGEKLYPFLNKLQGEGFHVAPQSAAPTEFLKNTFGLDVGYASLQEGTGADTSIKVFRILDDVVVTYDKADARADEKVLDPSWIPSADSGYQIRRSAPYLMIRGGDTIVWMKARWARGL